MKAFLFYFVARMRKFGVIFATRPLMNQQRQGESSNLPCFKSEFSVLRRIVYREILVRKQGFMFHEITCDYN